MFNFLSQREIEAILDAILPSVEWILVLFPLISIYVTFVHFKWWRLYRPSPLIKHLLISSIAVDISAIIVAFIAANVLGLIDVDLPDGANAALLATSLFIAMGVKVYRRISLRKLDNPDVDIEQRVETQNQREDRQFGEERRALEVEHNTGNETDNQREDREVGDAKRILLTERQDNYNDANQE